MKTRIEELDDLVMDDISELNRVIIEMSAPNVRSLCGIINSLIARNSELRMLGRANNVAI